MNPKSLGRSVVATLLVSASLIVLLATPASAHTGFDESFPTDGEHIEEPVSEISLRFGGESSPVGDGFVVLDGDGVIRVPDEVTSSDNLTWILRFDEPLTEGTVGVRWKVAAADAHPIEGSFSFTIGELPIPDEFVPPPEAAELTGAVLPGPEDVDGVGAGRIGVGVLVLLLTAGLVFGLSRRGEAKSSSSEAQPAS